MCPYVDPAKRKQEEANAAKKSEGKGGDAATAATGQFGADELETARAEALQISHLTGMDPEMIMGMKPGQRAKLLKTAKQKQMEKNKPTVTIVVEKAADEAAEGTSKNQAEEDTKVTRTK